MGERLVGYRLPGLADRGNRPFQVDRVPEYDGGHHQIQPTGAMPLVFVRAVPQLTQPVKEYRPCQGVFRLSFIEPDMDAPPQFDAADVLEQEQRPLNLCVTSVFAPSRAICTSRFWCNRADQVTGISSERRKVKRSKQERMFVGFAAPSDCRTQPRCVCRVSPRESSNASRSVSEIENILGICRR